MKLIYGGKFDGNQNSLPEREHLPGATRFKEFDNPKTFALVMNIISFVLAIILVAITFVIADWSVYMCLGAILPMFCLFPHEILHAICFKGEVRLYTDFSKGLLFVVGTETMSKARFIFMSMLPNLIFGFIPFILFLFMPQLNVLGMFGAVNISMGIGDYYNVFNALTQMPKGARTYISKFNSYWYIPEKNNI